MWRRANRRRRATGVFNARGTLGTDPTVPVGVSDVVTTFHLDTSADDAALDRLPISQKRYCVVGQSSAQAPRIRCAASSERPCR